MRGRLVVPQGGTFFRRGLPRWREILTHNFWTASHIPALIYPRSAHIRPQSFLKRHTYNPFIMGFTDLLSDAGLTGAHAQPRCWTLTLC